MKLDDVVLCRISEKRAEEAGEVARFVLEVGEMTTRANALCLCNPLYPPKVQFVLMMTLHLLNEYIHVSTIRLWPVRHQSWKIVVLASACR